MRLDYIVSRIEAHKDGALYVYITYSYSGDFNAGTYKNTAGYSFGPSTRITSPEGLMNDLPKAMADIGGGEGEADSATFNMSMIEYKI